MAMTSKQVKLFLHKLNQGWLETEHDTACEFVKHWNSVWDRKDEVTTVGQNFFSFETEILGLYLRDMDRVTFLVVNMENKKPQDIKSLIVGIQQRQRVPFLFVLGDILQESLKYAKRTVVFSASTLAKIFTSMNPKEIIKELAKDQISDYQLIPYTIIQPVSGNMFFGRNEELRRIREETTESFAIVGPGRIGKTSLVKQYIKSLKEFRDPRALRVKYVDCYSCCAESEDGITKFIMMNAEPCKESYKLKADELGNYIKRLKNKYRGPLELVLDEVDEICSSKTFNELGNLARDGHCRLVICGKGELLKLLLSINSSYQFRLDLVRLKPLVSTEAMALFDRPFRDMSVKYSQELANEVIEMTGRMPHLIQFFGKNLLEKSIGLGKPHLDSNDLDAVINDFTTSQFILSALDGIENNLERYVALLLLKHHSRTWNFDVIQKIVKENDLDIELQKLRSICNKLVIQNILTWEGSNFSKASELLVKYARDYSYFEEELENLKQAIDKEMRYQLI
jgi:AAA+ ATPase superfamily predicted ATPase